MVPFAPRFGFFGWLLLEQATFWLLAWLLPGTWRRWLGRIAFPFVAEFWEEE